jgi:hypothetical protein
MIFCSNGEILLLKGKFSSILDFEKSLAVDRCVGVGVVAKELNRVEQNSESSESCRGKMILC